MCLVFAELGEKTGIRVDAGSALFHKVVRLFERFAVGQEPQEDHSGRAAHAHLAVDKHAAAMVLGVADKGQRRVKVIGDEGGVVVVQRALQVLDGRVGLERHVAHIRDVEDMRDAQAVDDGATLCALVVSQIQKVLHNLRGKLVVDKQRLADDGKGIPSHKLTQATLAAVRQRETGESFLSYGC